MTGKRQLLAVGVALVVAVPLAFGAGYLWGRVGGHPPATPSPSSSGKLLWEARMDGTSDSFSGGTLLVGTQAQVIYTRGSVDFTVRKPPVLLLMAPRATVPYRYRIELALSAEPGSRSVFIIGLGWAAQAIVGLSVDTENRQLALVSSPPLSPSAMKQDHQPVGSPVGVPALAGGRTIQLAAVVDEKAMVFLDGKQVLSASDARPVGGYTTFQLEGGPGTLHLLQARIFALP